jgi:4-hydroxybenzoate polyprenyltransferase
MSLFKDFKKVSMQSRNMNKFLFNIFMAISFGALLIINGYFLEGLKEMLFIFLLFSFMDYGFYLIDEYKKNKKVGDE